MYNAYIILYIHIIHIGMILFIFIGKLEELTHGMKNYCFQILRLGETISIIKLWILIIFIYIYLAIR